MKAVTVNAEYTGGNIWLFYGNTSDGNYFICDDYGNVQILNADPMEDFEECCFDNWQQEHLIKELNGDERVGFCMDMLNILKSNPAGGITEMEIDAYKMYMKGEM